MLEVRSEATLELRNCARAHGNLWFFITKYRQLPLNYNIRPLKALNGAIINVNNAIGVMRNYI